VQIDNLFLMIDKRMNKYRHSILTNFTNFKYRKYISRTTISACITNIGLLVISVLREGEKHLKKSDFISSEMVQPN